MSILIQETMTLRKLSQKLLTTNQYLFMIMSEHVRIIKDKPRKRDVKI